MDASHVSWPARWIIRESYTDYRAIARKQMDCFLAKEGDDRVLFRNNPAKTRATVRRTVGTSTMTGWHVFCIGNYTLWNMPPSAIKRHLDLCVELCNRLRN